MHPKALRVLLQEVRVYIARSGNLLGGSAVFAGVTDHLRACRVVWVGLRTQDCANEMVRLWGAGHMHRVTVMFEVLPPCVHMQYIRQLGGSIWKRT